MRLIFLLDTFDTRFGSQSFNDPAIMSVAARDMFGNGQGMSQTMHNSHLGPNASGQLDTVRATSSTFQSPLAHRASVTSPPPGFSQPTGRAQAIRQASQTSSPMVSVHGIAMTDSPALTTGKCFLYLCWLPCTEPCLSPLLKGVLHIQVEPTLLDTESAFIS
jgi:hypothetical protein